MQTIKLFVHMTCYFCLQGVPGPDEWLQHSEGPGGEAGDPSVWRDNTRPQLHCQGKGANDPV